jgi:hypothetical protein
MSASFRAGRVGGEDRIGLRHRLEAREERALRVEVLENRLDDDIGVPRAIARHIRDQPVERVAHAPLVAQAPLEELGRALDRGGDALGRRVLQRHREAAHGADRRDVAAHDPGADDVHVARLEGGARGERLHPLLQEENPDQVLRGRVIDQRLDRRRKGSCDARTDCRRTCATTRAPRTAPGYWSLRARFATCFRACEVTIPRIGPREHQAIHEAQLSSALELPE